MSTVLIVGAGLTGLSAARHALERGWAPLLVDKGTGPGGRLATRWIGERESRFDTGAQFFSVRDPAFAAAVDGWAASGLARSWGHGFAVLTRDGLRDGQDGHVRWRITGGMNRLAKHLADGLDLCNQHTVTGLRVAGGRWQVTLTPGDAVRGKSRGADRQEQADAVLLTQPVPQILALLGASSVAVSGESARRLAGVGYDPCICLLFDLPDDDALLPEPGAVRIDDPSVPVSWIASQRRKGLRSNGEGLVLHFRGAWSAERFDLGDDELLAAARAAAAPVLERLGIHPPTGAAQLTKWRHSLATTTLPERCLRLDPGAPLVLAGDAFGDTPRVEGAWLSGRAAALALGDAR